MKKKIILYLGMAVITTSYGGQNSDLLKNILQSLAKMDSKINFLQETVEGFSRRLTGVEDLVASKFTSLTAPAVVATLAASQPVAPLVAHAPVVSAVANENSTLGNDAFVEIEIESGVKETVTKAIFQKYTFPTRIFLQSKIQQVEKQIKDKEIQIEKDKELCSQRPQFVDRLRVEIEKNEQIILKHKTSLQTLHDMLEKYDTRKALWEGLSQKDQTLIPLWLKSDIEKIIIDSIKEQSVNIFSNYQNTVKSIVSGLLEIDRNDSTDKMNQDRAGSETIVLKTRWDWMKEKDGNSNNRYHVDIFVEMAKRMKTVDELTQNYPSFLKEKDMSTIFKDQQSKLSNQKKVCSNLQKYFFCQEGSVSEGYKSRKTPDYLLIRAYVYYKFYSTPIAEWHKSDFVDKIDYLYQAQTKEIYSNSTNFQGTVLQREDNALYKEIKELAIQP